MTYIITWKDEKVCDYQVFEGRMDTQVEFEDFYVTETILYDTVNVDRGHPSVNSFS